MTTYNWSALSNAQIVSFVPGADVLHIDDASVSAADMGFSFTPGATDTTNGRFTISLDGKSVTFGVAVSSPAPFGAITTSNFTFADGSFFIVGDNTLSTASDDLANTLTGGNGNDLFVGLGGNDTMTGGAGNDIFYTAYSVSALGND